MIVKNYRTLVLYEARMVRATAKGLKDLFRSEVSRAQVLQFINGPEIMKNVNVNRAVISLTPDQFS